MNAGKKESADKKSGGFDVDLSSGGGLMEMMGSFTVLRLVSLMGAAGVKMTKEIFAGFFKKSLYNKHSFILSPLSNNATTM